MRGDGLFSSALSRPLVFFIAFLGLWEYLCTALEVPRFVVPKPSAIAQMFHEHFGTIVGHASQTIATTLIGFVIGSACAFLLGVVLGASRRVHAAVFPTLIGINSIPKVAFVPLIVLWAGIGTPSAVITSAVIVIFPIAVVVAGAIAAMDADLRDVLRSLGASRLVVLTKVAIPQAMPHFFGALKIGVTLSFVGTILAESIAANRGIGYMMTRAASDFEVELVFSGLVATAMMGVGLFCALLLFETRIVGWSRRRA